MKEGEKFRSVLILVILIIAIGAVYFWRQEFFNLFFGSYYPPASIRPGIDVQGIGVEPIAKPPEGLGSDIVSQVENPVEGKLPEANPFSAPLNPFENVYKNPFSQ